MNNIASVLRVLYIYCIILISLLAAISCDNSGIGAKTSPANGDPAKSDLLIYKQDGNSNMKTVFSIGDVDNPFLFRLSALTDKTGITASITIKASGKENPLYHADNLQAVTNEQDQSAVFVGPNAENPVDFAALIGDSFIIAIVVEQNGMLYATMNKEVRKANPGFIYSWRDLQKMQNNLSRQYVLQNDVIFPKPGSNGFTAFLPIGSHDNPFTGILDGNNKSIEGLYIAIQERNTRADDQGVGLFGAIQDAGISNMVINHSGIQGFVRVGALAGYAKNANVENVGMNSSANALVVGISYVGGLVGQSDGSTINGYTTGAVSGEHSSGQKGNSIGGLVGEHQSSGSVSGYVTGDVSGYIYVGGLVGENNSNGDIAGYVTGNIRGQEFVGGLVGNLQRQGTGKLTGYVTGSVSGQKFVGGLASGLGLRGNVQGYMRGSIIRSKDSSDVTFGYLTAGEYDTTSFYKGTGYFSMGEARMEGIAVGDSLGGQGAGITVEADTSQNDFSLFTFDDNTWVWVADGRWPAVDIGVIKPANEQPLSIAEDLPEDCAVEINKPALNGDTYEIGTWQELQWVEHCLNASYSLKNDIAIPAAGIDGIGAEGFVPLGNSATPFTGNFDGKGYKISGFFSRRENGNYVGLFGAVRGSTIRNLLIQHNGIEGGYYVGALAGYAETVQVENVGVESSGQAIIKGLDQVGGLLGELNGGSLKGYAVSAVKGEPINFYTGGMNVGGLVGYIQGGVVDGYAEGDVTGRHSVGGLAGSIQDNSMVNGYTAGRVYGESFVGGLIGYAVDNGGSVRGYARSIIHNTSSNKENADFGLFMGKGDGAEGYFSASESSIANSELQGDVLGLHGERIYMEAGTDQSSFTLLDFSSGPWEWVENGKWPAVEIGTIKPAAEQPIEPRGTIAECSVGADTPTFSAGVYEISTWQELMWINNCPGGSYVLTQSITIPSAGSQGMLMEGFIPIGNSIQPFTGSFDGNGNTVSGFVYSKETGNNVGLFGYVKGATIRNILIDHSGILGYNNVGALAGKVIDATIENVGMESSVDAEIQGGGSYLGGLVGFAENSTITGYAVGQVTGVAVGLNWRSNSFLGGLAGFAKNSTITGYALVNVEAISNVGGLVGLVFGTSRVTGYTKGRVKGATAVGGLVGMVGSDSTIIGYARGTIASISGMSAHHGYLIGSGMGVGSSGYYSEGESGGIDVTLTDGYDGNKINVQAATTQNNFSEFDFSSNDSKWEWVEDGKWPAIKIGTIKPAHEQPVARR